MTCSLISITGDCKRINTQWAVSPPIILELSVTLDADVVEVLREFP